MLSPKLETKRLVLRRYNESDIDAFYEILHDARLHKYIPFPDLTKDEELEYIITNTKKIVGGKVYSLQFSINNIVPQTIVDGSSIQFCVGLQADYLNKTYEKNTNLIKSTINTKEFITSAKTNDGKVYNDINSARGGG